MPQRFWEIDAARGIAIVLMVVFNWAFALQYLQIANINWGWLFWWVITTFFVGMRHPPAMEEEPLTPGRRAIGVASLVLFAITFMPVPISM